MSGIENLADLLLDDTVPAEVARIPVRTLEAIGERLAEVAQERTNVMDSQRQFGYIEGRHDLVREIVEIISREMAPAAELHRQLTEEIDRG